MGAWTRLRVGGGGQLVTAVYEFTEGRVTVIGFQSVVEFGAVRVDVIPVGTARCVWSW